jgi:hypothetical protein
VVRVQQLEIDLWIGAQKIRHERVDHRSCELRRRAHAHLALGPAGQLTGGVDRARGSAHHLPAVARHLRARFGDPHLARRALQQAGRERFLEALDLPADSRRRAAQLARRHREIAGLDHARKHRHIGQQREEFVGVHRAVERGPSQKDRKTRQRLH